MPDTNAEALGPPFVEMPALCICHNVNKGALVTLWQSVQRMWYQTQPTDSVTLQDSKLQAPGAPILCHAGMQVLDRS